jgi:mRNA interferase RelE/StbE
MAFYNIRFSESVHKDIKKIPQNDVKKILEHIDSLAIEPRPYGYKKLKGQENYRIRQGDYRIIYSIRDIELMILILTIGHRKDVYRFNN